MGLGRTVLGGGGQRCWLPSSLGVGGVVKSHPREGGDKGVPRVRDWGMLPRSRMGVWGGVS